MSHQSSVTIVIDGCATCWDQERNEWRNNANGAMGQGKAGGVGVECQEGSAGSIAMNECCMYECIPDVVYYNSTLDKKAPTQGR